MAKSIYQALKRLQSQKPYRKWFKASEVEKELDGGFDQALRRSLKTNRSSRKFLMAYNGAELEFRLVDEVPERAIRERERLVHETYNRYGLAGLQHRRLLPNGWERFRDDYYMVIELAIGESISR